MTEMKALVIRTAGEPVIAGAIAEGMNAAEVARLREENEMLRCELKRAQTRLELLGWGLSKDADKRLAEIRKKASKQPPMWARLIIGMRLVAGSLIK